MTEENIPKLRDLLVKHYGTSTMKMCSHQPLPKMTGPPLKFSLKPDAVTHAIHSPATIPIHWVEEVKKQLARNVEMGNLEEVPAKRPQCGCTGWWWSGIRMAPPAEPCTCRS